MSDQKLEYKIIYHAPTGQNVLTVNDRIAQCIQMNRVVVPQLIKKHRLDVSKGDEFDVVQSVMAEPCKVQCPFFVLNGDNAEICCGSQKVIHPLSSIDVSQPSPTSGSNNTSGLKVAN